MPRDLPDLLTDALPRDVGAPDLGAIESRVARRRAGRLGGAALALAAVVALGVQVLPLSPPAPMIDQVEDAAPDGTTVLPLPPAGEVAAAHANGRPVFVVHDDDGEVRVLDAISPHDPSRMPGLKVLAYCSRSGWFEDLWHGSKFAGNGAWVAGPAPYGLAEHTVVATTSETVTVGAMSAAPARGGLDGEEPIGESCTDVMGEDAPDALVLHDSAAGAVPGLLYPEQQDGEVVLPDEPQVPVAGPDVTLPVPAPGEVSADHANGRPVFVLNHDDGNVRVLDAVDPHVTEFGPKVLAWCMRWSPAPRVGGFPGGGVAVDLWYGSTFTGSGLAFGTGTGGVGPGGWTGGPAPTGLGRLPVRTVTGETVTVAGSPLPAPPRVGNDAIGTEGCSQAVALFPDAPPADPTILDDLVRHEPLFPDDWWYPTPERILGEEPGLPPEEWDRYLEETGPDPDRLGDLDLAELPSLGGTGLAVQREDGVELLALDGTSHGLLRGTSLTADASRDGHGGPVLVETSGGRKLWVDPSGGTTLDADEVTVLGGNEALVDRGDGTHESLTAYGPAEDGATVVPGPLRVGNGHRLASGPDCLMNAGASCGDGSRSIDTDMGGVGTTTPGCNPTDAFADFNLVSTCWLGPAAWLEVDTVGAEGADGVARIEMPRYPGQPDDQPTIGHFRDAVFGGPGVVAQLSLECEVPAVVGFALDGTPVDLWGGAAWSDGPTSVLLGTTVLPGANRPVPLVQVAAGPCGDAKGVPEGVWAITDDGPTQLNDVTAPAALWTAASDLDGIAPQLADREVAASACNGEAEVLVGDVDLDGDGSTDVVRHHTLADDHVEKLVACLADGGSAVRELMGPLEDLHPVVIGGRDALFLGGTTAYSSVGSILRVIGDRLVALGEPGASGLQLKFGALAGETWAWGCRARSGNHEDELVTVHTDAGDGDGRARVTIAVYGIDGAAAQQIDTVTETRGTDPAAEHAASGVAAELGLRPGCGRT